MASGFGLGGQQGRCYPFWREYQECLRTHGPEEALEECPRVREDYYECLHHRKEVRDAPRATRMARQRALRAMHERRDARALRSKQGDERGGGWVRSTWRRGELTTEAVRQAQRHPQGSPQETVANAIPGRPSGGWKGPRRRTSVTLATWTSIRIEGVDEKERRRSVKGTIRRVLDSRIHGPRRGWWRRCTTTEVRARTTTMDGRILAILPSTKRGPYRPLAPPRRVRPRLLPWNKSPWQDAHRPARARLLPY